MDHSITILSEKEKAILESYMLSADGLAEFWEKTARSSFMT